MPSYVSFSDNDQWIGGAQSRFLVAALMSRPNSNLHHYHQLQMVYHCPDQHLTRHLSRPLNHDDRAHLRIGQDGRNGCKFGRWFKAHVTQVCSHRAKAWSMPSFPSSGSRILSVVVMWSSPFAWKDWCKCVYSFPTQSEQPHIVRRGIVCPRSSLDAGLLGSFSQFLDSKLFPLASARKGSSSSASTLNWMSSSVGFGSSPAETASTFVPSALSFVGDEGSNSGSLRSVSNFPDSRSWRKVLNRPFHPSFLTRKRKFSNSSLEMRGLIQAHWDPGRTFLTRDRGEKCWTVLSIPLFLRASANFRILVLGRTFRQTRATSYDDQTSSEATIRIAWFSHNNWSAETKVRSKTMQN